MILYDRTTGRNAVALAHDAGEGRVACKAVDADVEQVVRDSASSTFAVPVVARARRAVSVKILNVDVSHPRFTEGIVAPLLSRYAIGSKGLSSEPPDILVMERLFQYLNL